MSGSPHDNGATLPLTDSKKGNGQINEDCSTEGDPCLEQAETKPKRQLPIWQKYLATLQKKTGLTRLWLFVFLALVLIAFVFFLVIVILAIAWPRLPHMLGYPLCRASECLRAASQLQENFNGSISPCADLWGSVCSKYRDGGSMRPPNQPLWNEKQFLVQKELERIRDLISTLKLPLHMGTVNWKLSHFYESCLDVDAIASDGIRSLTEIISELGGWNILRTLNHEDFDGMKLLTKLQARYGISPYFKVHVEPNPHEPNSFSIRISPSGLGLPDKNYYFRDSDDRIVKAYIDYIRDVVISMSSTSNDAARFGRDMFGYEKRLAEIWPDLTNLQNPITTYNAITLGELTQTISTIPFYDILQGSYREIDISENTEIIVTSLEYLGQLAQIISTTDKVTLNGYLIWSLVREYWPYLSEKYVSATESFNNELFGISKPNKRWETCSRMLQQHMFLATEYHLEELYPIGENTRNIVNRTFETIIDIIKEKIDRFDSTELLTQHLKSKLNAISLHIGLPPSVKTSKLLTDYYGPLRVSRLNLFENVQNSILFRKKIEEKMFLNTLPEGIFLKALSGEVPEVVYVPSRNAVVVPRSLVMEPFFEEGYPRPVLYGRLGTAIAFAVVSSILPFDSLWTSDRKILSPFHMSVNESFKSIQTNVDCLSRYISNSDNNDHVSTPTLALGLLKELAAIKIANEALSMAIELEGHLHYGGLEQYEESFLYFLAYAQTQCSESTRQYDEFRRSIQFKLPSKSLLRFAWNQLDSFKEGFGCDSVKSTKCLSIF